MLSKKLLSSGHPFELSHTEYEQRLESVKDVAHILYVGFPVSVNTETTFKHFSAPGCRDEELYTKAAGKLVARDRFIFAPFITP